MKVKFLILASLIVLLGFTVIGCNNNTQTDKAENNKTTNNQKTTEEGNNSKRNSKLTTQEYKNILIKNYEKYLKALELSEYDDIDDLLAKNKEIDNKNFIEEYKRILKDSKVNINSFRDSISNLNPEDIRLSELNESLVKESEVLIKDIERKEDELNKVDNTMLNKTSKELITYLENKLDNDNMNLNQFDDTLDKIEDLLGIDLDKNSKTNI